MFHHHQGLPEHAYPPYREIFLELAFENDSFSNHTMRISFKMANAAPN